MFRRLGRINGRFLVICKLLLFMFTVYSVVPFFSRVSFLFVFSFEIIVIITKTLFLI